MFRFRIFAAAVISHSLFVAPIVGQQAGQSTGAQAPVQRFGQPVSRQAAPGQMQPGQVQPGQVQPGQVQPVQGAPQQQQIQIMDAQQAVAAGLARVAEQPFDPLSAQEQQYLDAVLSVWEKKTASIKRYECKFTRYHFDLTMHPTKPSSIATGSIKFMAPDKGLFEVSEVKTVTSKDAEPEYRTDPNRPYGEHWVCDGNWVHIIDRNEKKAVRKELPPDMRGAAIYNSPLPFLFGVKAEEIKQRYWVRPLPQQPGDDSVWLEAWPKRADDAGNYSRVQVRLSREDTLPSAIVVLLPNWRPAQQFREIYEFTERNTTQNLWDAVKENVFRQQFIPTKLPSDWNVIEEPWIPPQQVAQPAPNAAGGAAQQRMAQPPAGRALNR